MTESCHFDDEKSLGGQILCLEGLCVLTQALLAGFLYPVFMPFRVVFLQTRKEDAYILLLIIRNF